jgi:hypothetical protein
MVSVVGNPIEAGRVDSDSEAPLDRQTKNRVLTYALMVFVAASALYGIFITFTYSGDDLQYSSLIQTHATGDLLYYPTGTQAYLPHAGTAPAALPINPRYLLEWPTSLLTAKVWYGLGLTGTVVTPIQILHVAVGALGLSAFFLAVFQLVRNIPISLVSTAGLGLSVAYWTYSSHMDQSITMVTILCVALYVFVRQAQTGFTRSGLLLLVLVLAFASFYNLTAALSAFAFGVGVALFSRESGFFVRASRFVGFGVAYAFVVGVGIAAAIAIFDTPADITSPNFWRDATFAGRPDYLVSPVHDAIRAAFGLGKAEILFPGIYGSLNDYFDAATVGSRLMVLGYYCIVLLLLAAPLVVLAVRRSQLGDKGKIAAFLVVWLLVYTVFNWFWDPGYNKYWLMPVVCCWAIFALALDHVRTTLPRYYRPALGALVAFVALSFVVNLTSEFLPDSREQDNKWLAIATQMKRDSEPADVFLSPGHPMDFYISFFGRRDILSAKLASLESGNDEAALQATYAARIAAHRAGNGKVYVYGLDTLDDPHRAAFLKLLGSGTLTEEWTAPGTTIYKWSPAGQPVA